MLIIIYNASSLVIAANVIPQNIQQTFLHVLVKTYVLRYLVITAIRVNWCAFCGDNDREFHSQDDYTLLWTRKTIFAAIFLPWLHVLLIEETRLQARSIFIRVQIIRKFEFKFKFLVETFQNEVRFG